MTDRIDALILFLKLRRSFMFCLFWVLVGGHEKIMQKPKGKATFLTKNLISLDRVDQEEIN